MDLETLFSICQYSVMPAWALLVFAPRWKGTQVVVHTGIFPLAFGAVYLALAATNFFGGEGNFNSLEGVATMFENRGALLAGWVHYLVFDLFIGAWESRDSRRLGIPHLAVVPCLLLTLMAGPVGLLLYVALRMILKRNFSLGAPEPGT